MRKLLFLGLLALSTSCAELPPEPHQPSSVHIAADQDIPQTDIPPLVQQAPAGYPAHP